MPLKQYKSLSGKSIKWRPKSRPRTNASKIHNLAIQLIRELFPYAKIYEECVIPTENTKKKLYLDIYLPEFALAIEVDGRQHLQYCSFFHKSKADFVQQQINDGIKERWCEINDIKLIRLAEGQSYDEWRAQVLL